LNLLVIGGDHITPVLKVWELVHRIRPSTNLSKSEEEQGKSGSIAFNHKQSRVTIRKNRVSYFGIFCLNITSLRRSHIDHATKKNNITHAFFWNFP
jgi:hypothetical protein